MSAICSHTDTITVTELADEIAGCADCLAIGGTWVHPANVPRSRSWSPAMTLPELHLAGWRATKDTLHPYSQIVGKIRLATTRRAGAEGP